MGPPLGLAGGRVAAQCEHVVDAGLADLVEDAAQLFGGGADAAQVGHRLDGVAVLDVADDVERAVARGAAGPVRDRGEVGLQRAQRVERALEVALAVGRLGREELEREDRLALARAGRDDVVDPHGGK